MTTGIWALTLRDLFWLIFLAAIGIGWGVERTRFAREFNKLQADCRDHWMFPRPRDYQPSSESLERSAILRKLRLLKDDELQERFKLQEKPRYEFDCILTEMVRRQMVAALEESCGGDDSPHPSTLTALCRARAKPDPVRINVVIAEQDDDGKLIDYPLIQASIQNNHPAQREMWWTLGGDYRGGRSERWRIELTDLQGKRVHDSNFSSWLGGGILHPNKVAYGAETPTTQLYARAFVSPPASGRYRMQVIHSHDYIAGEPDLEGLMVWKSDPTDVIVENHDSALHRRMTIVPLFLILAVVIGFFVRRGKVARPAWRDWIAVGLAVGLAVGWFLDVQHLRRKAEPYRWDTTANWTLRLADDPK